MMRLNCSTSRLVWLDRHRSQRSVELPYLHYPVPGKRSRLMVVVKSKRVWLQEDD